MILDTHTGTINGDLRKFSLSDRTTERDLLHSALGKEILNQSSVPAANHYTLREQHLGGTLFLLFLSFNRHSKLGMVQICLKSDDYPKTWENWSEQRELQIKAEHDAWLESQIGPPPYRYTWGEIVSAYDPRSGSSMITIRYYKNGFDEKKMRWISKFR